MASLTEAEPVTPRPEPLGSNVALGQVGQAFRTRPAVMLPLSNTTKMIQFLTKLPYASLVRLLWLFSRSPYGSR